MGKERILVDTGSQISKMPPDRRAKKSTVTQKATNRYQNNFQLKPGHCPFKLVLLHLHEDVGREIEKLIRPRHREKINEVDEGCFVSPVMITVKNNKSVRIYLDSR